MKKFLITLIYATLATMVVAYLFKMMNWPGFGDLSLGIFWLHIGAYLTYSLMVPDKDSRILYPMIALVVGILVNMFKIGLDSEMLIYGLFVVFLVYVAFHLFAKDYLDKNDLKVLRKISIGAFAVFVTAVLMKLMHLQGAQYVLITGSAAVAFMLLITGMTKGLERNK